MLDLRSTHLRRGQPGEMSAAKPGSAVPAPSESNTLSFSSVHSDRSSSSRLEHYGGPERWRCEKASTEIELERREVGR